MRDFDRELSARDILVRDIERERIGLRGRLKDLVEQVKAATNDEDRADSSDGIKRIEKELEGATERYQIVIGELPDGPEIASEIERSVELHAQDVEHLA